MQLINCVLTFTEEKSLYYRCVPAHQILLNQPQHWWQRTVTWLKRRVRCRYCLHTEMTNFWFIRWVEIPTHGIIPPAILMKHHLVKLYRELSVYRWGVDDGVLLLHIWSCMCMSRLKTIMLFHIQLAGTTLILFSEHLTLHHILQFLTCFSVVLVVLQWCYRNCLYLPNALSVVVLLHVLVLFSQQNTLEEATVLLSEFEAQGNHSLQPTNQPTTTISTSSSTVGSSSTIKTDKHINTIDSNTTSNMDDIDG